MEKKTQHRILGVLVVVGIVIVSLPLFQGGGHESTTTLVNAPAFPDQSVQVNTSPSTEPKSPASTAIQTSPIPIHDPSADTGINQLPDDTIVPNAVPNTPVQAPSMAQPGSGMPIPKPDNSDNNPVDDNSSAEQPTGPVDNGEPSPNSDNTDPDAMPSKNPHHITDMVTEAPKAITQDAAAPITDKIVSPATETTAPQIKKAFDTKKHIVTSPKMRAAALKQKPTTNDINGLIKLKQSVWVIQLGSFKNKENALRLVNKLRLKGYHAFIQQADARTRVFVGPESKQQIARMVASQLEEELHLNGMVISYKPLAL